MYQIDKVANHFPCALSYRPIMRDDQAIRDADLIDTPGLYAIDECVEVATVPFRRSDGLEE